MGKEVRNVQLPNMPMGAASFGATIHNSKVYVSAFSIDGNGKFIFPILVYSVKWSTLPKQQRGAAIAVLDNHVTLIGGVDVSRKVINTLSSWYEEEGRWKQVLPPMPTGRYRPAVLSHDNLLLVTGGVSNNDSILNTTDVLDLTTMKWTSPKGLNLSVPLRQHHLALCGEYLYLVGGVKVLSATVNPRQSPEDFNSQAWRAKWSDVKQIAAPHHSQSQSGVWTRIADPPTLLPTPVSCGGTLYTVGGLTRDGERISTVYTYIPARNQWDSVGDMSVGRVEHCAVPLSSNTIFVAGGFVGGKWAFSSFTELLLL